MRTSASQLPRIELLESRIAPAFVASLNGLEATLLGDASSETLTLVNSGGMLAHNRYTVGDPGFASDFDFDSSAPGDQTLAAVTSTVIIRLGAGDDIFSSTGSMSPLRISGGSGNDTISGGNLADTLSGGPGHDVIDGNQGSDIMTGGDGADRLIWDPGDGSDKIDGNAGDDRMIFNGSAASEIFDLSAENGRLRFLRNIGNITMDVGTVETVETNLLGGADTLTVNDLSSTDVRAVLLHLGVPLGGTTGDLQTDIVNIKGTQLDDDIRVRTSGGLIEVVGLSSVIKLDGFDGGDSLNVSGESGVDNVIATAAARAALTVTTDGESESSAPPAFQLGSAAGYDVGKNPVALAAGNLFGTGNDLVVANAKSNSLTVLFNAGNGTFASVVELSTGGIAPKAVVLEDFDGDQFVDIAVTNSGSGNVSVLLNNGDGTFTEPTLFATGSKPGALRTADIDGDGDSDLVMITAGNRLSVLSGDGLGGFGAPTSIPTGGAKPVDFLVEDINGDGHRDLAIAHNGSNDVTILTANADFTFANPIKLRVGLAPTTLATGDFNGDGRADLAVTHGVSRFVSVLVNTSTAGVATFQPQLKLAHPGKNIPAAVAVGDINLDGRDDIVVANFASGSVSAFLGAGNVVFKSPLRVDLDDTPPRSTSALVLTDLNGDGRKDIAVTNSGTDDLSLIVGLPV